MATEPEPGVDGAADVPIREDPAHVARADLEVTSERSALPAEIIIQALAKERLRSLDGSTVPLWLMTEPVNLGLDWLEAHGKRCRQPQQCRDTPGPLRRLLKIRRAARRQHLDAVHSALWRFPETSMVATVRSDASARHQDLVESITSGSLFEPEALESELGDLDRRSAGDLATALWSTGLADPRSRELFGLLPAMVERIPVPAAEVTAETPRRGQESTEKIRHRDKRLALEAKVVELESALTSARATTRERSAQLAAAHRDLEHRAEQITDLEKRLGEVELELEQSSQDAKAKTGQLRDAERSLKQASATGDALRTELRRTQADLAEVESERSGLVRRLAGLQADMQNLTARFHAVPRDREAVADWLEREEVRLRDQEYTLEGGARDRVVEEKRLRRKLELAFLEAYPEFKGERPAPAADRRALTFHALGGGHEVGRSAYLIRIGIHDVLVDCGIAVGAQHEEDQLPDLSSVDRLDALLVTHAHTDHIGWIPALVAALDYFPIHCTKPTAELLPVMLRDSRSHYERALAESRLQQEHSQAPQAVEEAYTRDDILDTETRLFEARMDERFGVGGTDLTATFFPAGHILGAASIVLEGGGRRVVFSGDISSEYQHTVGAFQVPDWVERPDLLVLESTYGDRVRPPLKVAEDALIKFVADTVTHGVALLPSFALGRAQEVLAILKRARTAGRLPPDLKIVADGMINKINPTYIEHAKLEGSDFVEISGPLDRELAIQGAIGTNATPTVVVTTSGMLTGGPVIEWARRLLPDARHRMALLGYQDEGAPGGLLKKMLRERPPYPLTLRDEHGQPVEIRVASSPAQIALSAHADQDGLVRYAAAVKPERVVLVHGDDDARATLRDRLLREKICEHVELSQQFTVT